MFFLNEVKQREQCWVDINIEVRRSGYIVLSISFSTSTTTDSEGLFLLKVETNGRKCYLIIWLLSGFEDEENK